MYPIIEDSNDLVRVVAFFCFFFWPNKKRKIESTGLNSGNYFQMKIILSVSSD